MSKGKKNKVSALDSLKGDLSSMGSLMEDTQIKEASQVTTGQKQSTYYDYMAIPVNAAKNGAKYKSNISLSEDVAKKFTYMQIFGGYNQKERSLIGETALDLLYEIYYELKEKGVDVLKERTDAQEILKMIKDS